ncbi:MAG TPA: RDD family protein [Steroidobacteraceae bacterium]|nr:RDD family protein [Steroidobacteraceae bacterium]
MNTSTLRRLFSILVVLTLCATAHRVLALSPEANAAPNPAAAAIAASAAPAAAVPAPANAAADIEDGRHLRGGDDLISFGRDSILALGRKADSVVSIFGSSTSDGEATDVVSVFGDTRVTGPLHDSAVAVFGNLYIDSKIEGDAVAVFGNVELGPHAQLDGNLVSIGGTVHRDPAATVRGGIENIFSGNFASLNSFGWLRTWIHHCLLYGRPLAVAPGLGWAWGLALGCLALYVFLALLFREGLFRCVETLEAQPGHTVLAALITMLLTPVLLVLLCITLLGIAAIPFVALGLLCIGLFGKAVMLAWLGRRVAGRPATGPLSHPAVAVLIGGVLVLLSYLVPVLGFLVYKLLGLVGLGAVVYTLVLAVRAREARKNGIDATPPPSMGETHLGDSAATPGTAATATTAPPQLISAALPRAGFLRRMGALLIDALLIGFLTGMLGHVFHTELLVLATYGAIMWKLRGSTVGGLVLDLKVVRLDGREMDWSTAVVRALGCFLSLAVAGLGFFWIAFDRDSQAWHDKIAGTVVVRVAKGAPLV